MVAGPMLSWLSGLLAMATLAIIRASCFVLL